VTSTSEATSRRWGRPVTRRRDTRRTAQAAAMDKYLQANRPLWDEWTGINYRSDFYKVEAFKAGRHCPRDERPSRGIPPRVHVLRVAGLLPAAGRRWPLS